MHKVRVNYSSCTGKNIYNSSGGAQGKKRIGVKTRRFLIQLKNRPTLINTPFFTHSKVAFVQNGEEE